MRYRYAVALLALVASPAFAVALNSLAFVTVPALDDVGLAAIALVVGIAGAIAARRRNRK